jgi:hypothetical protein
MKLRTAAVAAICLGLLLAGRPAAAQSLYGPGGLFLHPTASTPEKGKITPAFLLLPQTVPPNGDSRLWLSSSLDYGLTDDIELTLTALKVTGWQRDASFGGSAKWRFLRETRDRPALAVGFAGLGFGDVNGRSVFLAAQKRIPTCKRFPLTAHLGVQYVDEQDGILRREVQPFGGLELGLGSRWTFVAEARPGTEKDFGTPLALTLSYRVTDRWKLALTWANNGQSDRPVFGFGAGFGLGARGR